MTDALVTARARLHVCRGGGDEPGHEDVERREGNVVGGSQVTVRRLSTSNRPVAARVINAPAEVVCGLEITRVSAPPPEPSHAAGEAGE